jgi:hypothetical protein
MSVAARVFVCSILFGAGVAACTPAAYVQQPRIARHCDVKVCRDLNTGLARCECKTHEQLARQGRDVLWPRVNE